MRMMRKVAFVVVTALLIAGVWVVTASADGDANGAACRAVTWLQSQQKPDGGFGAGGKSSAPVTADVVYVLGLLGEEVDGPSWTTPDGNNALDALEALGVPAWAQADPGQAGKVARAVAVAGANPRDFGGVDLVAMIESFYDPATGLYHPAWLFRHSLAMEGLLRSGVTVPRAAYDALLAAQLPDGAWFWSKDGTQGDVDTTGRVFYLLAGFAKVPVKYP